MMLGAGIALGPPPSSGVLLYARVGALPFILSGADFGFVPWNASQGTVLVAARTGATSGSQVVLQIDDGTNTNRIQIVREASTNVRGVITTGGVQVCAVVAGTVADNTSFRLAFGFRANDFAASLNGAAVVTDTAGGMPTGIVAARVGSAVAGFTWLGSVTSIVYVPRRMTNAELVAWAAP